MIIPIRALAAFVLAASVLALASAYTAQYGFGLRPCNLCLIQRVPFAMAGLLGMAALLPAAPPRRRQLLVTLAGLLLLINGGIAFYHVGVEQHWWVSAVCAGSNGTAISVEDLMAQMDKPIEVSCDTPAWSFHGITMATLNIVYSGGLGVLVLALARRAGGTRGMRAGGSR